MERFQMNRNVWICFGIGILTIIIGWFNGPLLPYQDPTPELIKIYNEQAYRARVIMNCGYIVMGIGLLLFTTTRIFRKNNEDLTK